MRPVLNHKLQMQVQNGLQQNWSFLGQLESACVTLAIPKLKKWALLLSRPGLQKCLEL